jgi:hypothetical protein
MPIQINLLAEAQAAEELRRKDPVKRGIWIAGFLVSLVLLWILKLQCDIWFGQNTYNRLENEWKRDFDKYAGVTNQQARTAEVNQKLAALDNLATNRFLWAPVLNALQKTMVDHIQVTHIWCEQAETEEAAHDVGSGSSKMHVAGGMVEKIILYIEAEDTNPKGRNYDKYKESLCSSDFFVKSLKRKDGFVLDGTLSGPVADPSDPGRQFVTFKLKSIFPEVVHQ